MSAGKEINLVQSSEIISLTIEVAVETLEATKPPASPNCLIKSLYLVSELI